MLWSNSSSCELLTYRNFRNNTNVIIEMEYKTDRNLYSVWALCESSFRKSIRLERFMSKITSDDTGDLNNTIFFKIDF